MPQSCAVAPGCYTTPDAKKEKMKFKKGTAGNREDGFGAREAHISLNAGASKANGIQPCAQTEEGASQ